MSRNRRPVREFVVDVLRGVHGFDLDDWTKAAETRLKPILTDEQWERLMELLKALEPFIPLILILL